MAATGRAPVGETRILRETILRHVDRRVEKISAEIKEAVLDDFGSCGDRRFTRQLSYLVKVGCVRMGRDWDLELGWWRPTYVLLSRKMPGVQRSFCGLCGMVGTRTSSHPLHLRLARELHGQPPYFVPIKRSDERKCLNCGSTAKKIRSQLLCVECTGKSPERQSVRRAEAISIGLCGECFLKKLEPGATMCSGCLRKHRDRQRARARRSSPATAARAA